MTRKGVCSYRKDREYESNLNLYRVKNGYTWGKLSELSGVRSSELIPLLPVCHLNESQPGCLIR